MQEIHTRGGKIISVVDNAKSEVIKVDVGNVIFSDTNGTQKKKNLTGSVGIAD